LVVNSSVVRLRVGICQVVKPGSREPATRQIDSRVLVVVRWLVLADRTEGGEFRGHESLCSCGCPAAVTLQPPAAGALAFCQQLELGLGVTGAVTVLPFVGWCSVCGVGLVEAFGGGSFVSGGCNQVCGEKEKSRPYLAELPLVQGPWTYVDLCWCETGPVIRIDGKGVSRVR
jgi:hypothetical protein